MIPDNSFYRVHDKETPYHGDQSFENLSIYEKIPANIFPTTLKATIEVAKEIAYTIREKQAKNELCILGLATGSSPISLYKELVRLHKEENLSFKNVVTFNLDEYFPMQADAIQSYHRFMYEHLFNHIDILKENIHIPDGSIDKKKVYEYCVEYEKLIESYGGIDLQILGIGRTGHIGFNEPGSTVNSFTRLITLDHLTRIDAVSDFHSNDNVPYHAITMGVGTILKSKKIILIAWGESKAPIIKNAIEGPITDIVPTSYLQNHKNSSVYLDIASAAELTRIKTPWLLTSCEWNKRLIRKAVVWLCQKLEKPILKLTDRDYADNGLSDLITDEGGSYNINIRIFNELQHTITGWPGGKPNSDDLTRPERKNPFPKRVVIFSPHPDDDVISMGGTLARLVKQGHDVHVVYQTSGSIAVSDDDVLRSVDFTNEFENIFKINDDKVNVMSQKVIDLISNKNLGDSDSTEVLQLKGAIRKSEAKSACRYIGVPDNNIHFLNMPFYETGEIKKNTLSEEDYQITEEILEHIKPHQIYAAGDLSDPHGTHRVCINAVLETLNRIKKKNSWTDDCWLWLYRGAWQEWDIDQADMAVPLSPDEVKIKRSAIFKHQSQKDTPLFPGIDTREFWKRAEDRNHGTAVSYDKLGMAEYQAMELFVKHQY